MSQQFRNIKGTFDVLPFTSESDGTAIPSSTTWYQVEEQIREVMRRFDVREIRTPILEPTELIARGIGKLTDIVSKEMFSFERGKTNYVLRPEVTAPVMRAFLQHRLDQAGGVQRLYYMGPCFRAERPQKGRYRQFHQFGIELIGSDAPEADAETIALMMMVYESLGVTDTRLRINTLGDETSRPKYREALREYFIPHESDLSETSRQRLETNPMRILDTKIPEEQNLLASAPRLIDFVDGDSRRDYEAVKQLLDDIGVAYEEDAMLVRGLDYYTRTAFELESPALGAQSALAGGGRYDLLATEIGSSKPVPAVGFAAGMERLFVAIAAAGTDLPEARPPDVFLLALGDEAARTGFGLATKLRRSGVSVATDLLGRSMKAQLREANRCNASYTIIIGKDELASGRAEVKDMSSGEQTGVDLQDVERYLLNRLSQGSDVSPTK